MTTDLDSDGFGGTMRPAQSGEVPMATTPADPPPRWGPLVALIATLAVVAIAVLVGVVVVVTQSQDDLAPEPPPTAGPTATAPAATESAPPTQDEAPTPENEAIAAAEEVYREYLRVSDDVTTTGNGDVAAFEAVAIGQALREAQIAAENYRLAGINQVGQPEVASLEAQSVSLTAEGDAVPEVTLDACLDLTDFDLVQEGRSVLDPNAPERAGSVVTIRNYPDRGGWLVASIAAEGARC